MRDNQLSDQIAPTIVVVFDDLLGVREQVPDDLRHRIKKLLLGHGERWTISPDVEAAVSNLLWRLDANLEVVTFTAPEGRVADLLEAAHFPAMARATTSQDLARELAYRPDIIAVYHPYPEHQFRYGPKGRYITKDALNLIGKI